MVKITCTSTQFLSLGFGTLVGSTFLVTLDNSGTNVRKILTSIAIVELSDVYSLASLQAAIAPTTTTTVDGLSQ